MIVDFVGRWLDDRRRRDRCVFKSPNGVEIIAMDSTRREADVEILRLNRQWDEFKAKQPVGSYDEIL
jgi:hypothetical protein